MINLKEMNFYFYEIVDKYQFEQQSRFYNLFGVIRKLHEMEEELYNPYTITFYLNMN